MTLQRIATRLAQQAVRIASKLTALNARRLARRAADKIIKSYSKPITQATVGMDIAKAGVKLDRDSPLEMALKAPLST